MILFAIVFLCKYFALGGSTINAIMQQSQTQVHVSSSPPPTTSVAPPSERLVTVTGRPDQVVLSLSLSLPFLSSSTGSFRHDEHSKLHRNPDSQPLLACYLGSCPLSFLFSTPSFRFSVHQVPNDALPFIRGKRGGDSAVDCEALFAAAGLSVNISGANFFFRPEII